MRIGVICPSEIAFRRFLPALLQFRELDFAGVAIADKTEFAGADDAVLQNELKKATSFTEAYGGRIYQGYQGMIEDDGVDAVYLPLPPGLHHEWARRVLLAGKHAFVEKPCTTRFSDTEDLLSLAESRGLAIHENYMFTFHRQMEQVRQIVESGRLGEVRLYRIDFGFPMRAKNDFRYYKALGGGALLDCAGYTMRCASYFLGPEARVVCGAARHIDGFEVDMYGSATMVNNQGVTAQLGWGMDNNYRCSLDIWGSGGTFHTDRILTAPAGFIPHATIKIGNDLSETIALDADDAFRKSIEHFYICTKDEAARKDNYAQLRRQASLIDQFYRISGL